jgi:hypothetical protein
LLIEQYLNNYTQDICAVLLVLGKVYRTMAAGDPKKIKSTREALLEVYPKRFTPLLTKFLKKSDKGISEDSGLLQYKINKALFTAMDSHIQDIICLADIFEKDAAAGRTEFEKIPKYDTEELAGIISRLGDANHLQINTYKKILKEGSSGESEELLKVTVQRFKQIKEELAKMGIGEEEK